MSGLWLTALLQIATAVLTDWESHLQWDCKNLGSRAVELWREAGEAQLSSFVFEVNGISSQSAEHRWDYHEHGTHAGRLDSAGGTGWRGGTSGWTCPGRRVCDSCRRLVDCELGRAGRGKSTQRRTASEAKAASMARRPSDSRPSGRGSVSPVSTDG